jgi:hypothetical protein
VDGGRKRGKKRNGKRLVDSQCLSSSLARELGRTTPFRGGFADGPVMNRCSEAQGSIDQMNPFWTILTLEIVSHFLPFSMIDHLLALL